MCSRAITHGHTKLACIIQKNLIKCFTSHRVGRLTSQQQQQRSRSIRKTLLFKIFLF